MQTYCPSLWLMHLLLELVDVESKNKELPPSCSRMWQIDLLLDDPKFEIFSRLPQCSTPILLLGSFSDSTDLLIYL